MKTFLIAIALALMSAGAAHAAPLSVPDHCSIDNADAHQSSIMEVRRVAEVHHDAVADLVVAELGIDAVSGASDLAAPAERNTSELDLMSAGEQVAEADYGWNLLIFYPRYQPIELTSYGFRLASAIPIERRARSGPRRARE